MALGVRLTTTPSIHSPPWPALAAAPGAGAGAGCQRKPARTIRQRAAAEAHCHRRVRGINVGPANPSTRSNWSYYPGLTEAQIEQRSPLAVSARHRLQSTLLWNTGWGGRCRGRRWCWWRGARSSWRRPERVARSCWRRLKTKAVLEAGVDRQQRPMDRRQDTPFKHSSDDRAGAAVVPRAPCASRPPVSARKSPSSGRRLQRTDAGGGWPCPPPTPGSSPSGPSQQPGARQLGPAASA